MSGLSLDASKRGRYMGKKVRCEYQIYLQPQIRLDSGKVIGAEALVRATEVGGKIIVPRDFVTKTEMKEYIFKLDFFIMESVCRILNKWQSAVPNFHLSVNLSRATLNNPEAVRRMETLCCQYQLNPGSIVLGVAERSIAIKELDRRVPTYVDRIKKIGFPLSLDDYGSGFSNMKILSEIGFSELKIGKGLIDDITYNKKSGIIVQTTIDMCCQMGNIRCIADGIETEAQVRLLRELGCNYGQGSYFYRPMSVSDFEKCFFNAVPRMRGGGQIKENY